VLPVGSYIRDVEEGDIYYMLAISAPGATLDDDVLKHAITLTVAQVKVFGPVVADLVSGRITLNQALDALKQMVASAQG
jgi:hypothetical protein